MFGLRNTQTKKKIRREKSSNKNDFQQSTIREIMNEMKSYYLENYFPD